MIRNSVYLLIALFLVACADNVGVDLALENAKWQSNFFGEITGYDVNGNPIGRVLVETWQFSGPNVEITRRDELANVVDQTTYTWSFDGTVLHLDGDKTIEIRKLQDDWNFQVTNYSFRSYGTYPIHFGRRFD